MSNEARSKFYKWAKSEPSVAFMFDDDDEAQLVGRVAEQAWLASREQALEEAADAIAGMNDSAGDRAAYDNREMYDHEVERMHALSDAAEKIRALKSGE